MKDSRVEKLADTLLSYSVELKKGQNVLIRGNYEAKPMLKALIRKANEIGANVFFDILDDELSALSALNTNQDKLNFVKKWTEPKYRDIDAFVSVYATENDYETSIVPSDIRIKSAKELRPLSDIIVNEKKWVLMDWPTYGLAQKAKMSYDDFTDYVLDVCNVDYLKMRESFKPLKELMEKTDKVRIVSPGTDLSFSIKGIAAIPCAGECNIPDGEIYTAPVKDSVNGTITYNTPSPYQGVVYNDVKLTFKDGKIIEATASNDVDKLNEIFNTDDGARFVGEFAIGVNPQIMNPIGNILFDEKIAGSLHFTPGQCYDEASNTNKSAIHWDLVLIQRTEYGGGEIYFDDKLIRKDGLFVIDELKSLNWE